MKLFYQSRSNILCFVLGSLLIFSCKPSTEDNYYTDEIGTENLPIDSTSIVKLTPLLKDVKINNNVASYLLLDKIEIDSSSNLILADNSDYTIFKWDIVNNKRLLSFGRKGLGPSEFRYIKLLRYDKVRGIIVGDDLAKKCTIFDLNGQFKSTISFYELMDDIFIVNDSILIYSNYKCEPNYKPVKVYSIKNEKNISSFGNILEPQKGYFDFIKRNKKQENYLKDAFSYSSLTGLIYLKQTNRLILSQIQPYALWLIDLNTQKTKRFNKKVPYSTYNNLKTEILSDGRLRRTILKSGKQIHPVIFNEKIVSLITDSTNQKIYLDTYQLDGNFMKRFSIPSLQRDLWISDFVIDNQKILYVLVRDKNWVSWIERFRIKSDIFK